MTTNGLLLGDLEPWIKAGLTNLNVSLDTLDREEFHKITKSSHLARVLSVIDQAIELGVPTKVNTVLMRSINGSPKSINNLIDWAAERPLTLRFIELMDTGLNQSFATQERVLGTEIESLLINRGFTRQFKPSGTDSTDGPAVNYSHHLMAGRIGLINPLSGNFCSSCNRLRVTARGHLKLCLFGDHDSPLDLSSASAVALNVRQLIGTKPERHYLDVGNFGNVATFRTIGG
jgi:cyclic pyranopterin phosphate synthase